MQKYVVTAAAGVRFNPGARVMISEDQFARRRHALAETEAEGVHEVTAPVMFKYGEEVATDGDVNKALLQEIAKAGTDEANKARGKAAKQKKQGDAKASAAEKVKADAAKADKARSKAKADKAEKAKK